jgi:hypothetical protein
MHKIHRENIIQKEIFHKKRTKPEFIKGRGNLSPQI